MSIGTNQPGPDSTAGPERPQGGAARRVVRNTAVLVAGDAATKIGLFVLYALIARTLGEDGFGDYTLAISLAFFVRAAGLGIDVILSRETARSLENVHGLFWDSITFKVCAGSAVLAVVTGFVAASGYPEAVIVAVALIGASNLIDIVAYSSHAVLRGREEMAPGSIALALETTVVVLLGGIALIAFDGNLVALGAAYLVAALVSWAYIGAAMRRRAIRPRRKGGSRGLRWLGRAALPTGIASLFAYALGRVDAVILAVVTDDSGAVGLYGAAARIFEATLFVSWAFGLAILPMLSRFPRRSPALNRVFTYSCLAIFALTVPAGAAMALYGPAVTEGFFGTEFEGAGTAVRILGGATALYGLFTVGALALAAQDRQNLLPLTSGAALALNVGLNFALIPSLGVEGAAIATTAAQALMTATALILAVRETGGVSLARIGAAPVAGVAAMCLVAALAGPGLAALGLAAAVYAAVFLAVEWLLHGDDLRSFVQSLLRRPDDPGVTPEPS